VFGLASTIVVVALIASAVAFVAAIVAMLMDLLGVQPPAELVIVPFVLAVSAFFAVLITINDYQLGKIPLSRLWAVLRTLPRMALVAVGITAAALLAANTWDSLHPAGMSDKGELHTAAGILAWFSAITGLLAEGVRRQRRQPTASTPRAPGLLDKPWVRIGIGAILAVPVVAAIIVDMTRPGGPAFDNTTVHADLAREYAATIWAPHLQAANRSHGGLIVYLDTDDPDVADAACTALTEYAARFGRTAGLYVLQDGQATFLRSCLG
jgi:hypothetical protein